MGAPEPVLSTQDLQKIIADLLAGTQTWAGLSAEIRSQIEHTPNPDTGGMYSETSFGAGSGAPGLDLSKLFNQSQQAAAVVDPVLSAAQSYYFQLYGLEAPKGMLEKMVDSGLDLYAIQNQLLSTAGEQGAPGYDNIRYQNLLSAGNSLYFRLWGEDPPPVAVKNMVDNGLNLFQMEKSWRADPTFKDTRTYRDEQSQYAGVVANLLGTR